VGSRPGEKKQNGVMNCNPAEQKKPVHESRRDQAEEWIFKKRRRGEENRRKGAVGVVKRKKTVQELQRLRNKGLFTRQAPPGDHHHILWKRQGGKKKGKSFCYLQLSKSELYKLSLI